MKSDNFETAENQLCFEVFRISIHQQKVAALKWSQNVIHALIGLRNNHRGPQMHNALISLSTFFHSVYFPRLCYQLESLINPRLAIQFQGRLSCQGQRLSINLVSCGLRSKCCENTYRIIISRWGSKKSVIHKGKWRYIRKWRQPEMEKVGNSMDQLKQILAMDH